jgi:hypothetical protein
MVIRTITRLSISTLLIFLVSCSNEVHERKDTNEDDISPYYESSVPPEYEVPEEIDDETAVKVTKFLYYDHGPTDFRPKWDDLQVIVIPFYDIYGKEKSYLGLVYIAEGEMPTLDVIKGQIREGYEAWVKIEEIKAKKRKESKTEGISRPLRENEFEIPSDLKNKRLLKECIDPTERTERSQYWHTIYPAKIKTLNTTMGPKASIGIPDIMEYENEALKAVEDYTGKKAIFVGYTGSRFTGYWVKTSAGNNTYYSKQFIGTGRVRSEAEVKNIYDEGIESSKPGYPNGYNEMHYKNFRKILYQIENNPEIIDGTYNGRNW